MAISTPPFRNKQQAKKQQAKKNKKTKNKMPLNCCSRRLGGGERGDAPNCEDGFVSRPSKTLFYRTSFDSFLLFLIPKFLGYRDVCAACLDFWIFFRPSDYYERCQWTLRNIGHTLGINKKLKH